MRLKAIVELFDQVDGLAVDDDAKQAFRRLIRDVGIAHGVTSIDRSERTAYARRLLDLRVSRPTIRDRLVARYEICSRQAYRIIDEALKLGHKHAKNVTATEDDLENEFSFRSEP